MTIQAPFPPLRSTAFTPCRVRTAGRGPRYQRAHDPDEPVRQFAGGHFLCLIAQTFPQNIRDLAHGHEGSGADVTLSCRLRRRHRPNLQIREVSYIYNRSPQHRLPGSHGCLFCICARVPLTETESVGHFLWDGWADVSGGIPQRRPRRPRYLEHSTLSEPDIHSRMDLGVIDLTAILPAAP